MIYMATVTVSICSASLFTSVSQPTFPDNWLVLLDALYIVIVLDPSIIIGNRLFKNNYYPILQKEIEAKRD